MSGLTEGVIAVAAFVVMLCVIGIAQHQDEQTTALQQIAASLQGKPPIQVTVDFGQQTGAMLTDALKDKPQHNQKKESK